MINFETLKGIQNAVMLQSDIVGGGVPSQEALEEIKRQGFKAVIDLRTFLEGTAFMKKAVKKLGMKYYNIPVKGGNISEKEVQQLAGILAGTDNRPVLIHCAIGGRVLALWNKYQSSHSQP